MPALYNVQNPMERARGHMAGARSSYASQTRETPKQGKSVAGGLMSAAGGVMAGAELAPLLGATGPVGGAIGGIALLGAYLMS